MNHKIKTKENKPCTLAARVRNGNLEMYGNTLQEVCRTHEQSIRRTKSPQLKAVERTRYVEFMMCHITEFDRRSYSKTLGRIIWLCDCSISALTESSDSPDTQYRDALRILTKTRKSASKLLNEIGL